MSFYGSTYPVYPSIYQPTGYTPMHSSLAGYGGTYRVNQPSYYTGPSYSTTSDNDYPWYNPSSSVPPPILPQSGFSYGSGYSSAAAVGGYNGYSSNYFSNEPYNYTPHYASSYQQQQVVSAMPTTSYHQQQQQQQQQPHQQQHSSSSRSHSGTGSQANLANRGGSSSWHHHHHHHHSGNQSDGSQSEDLTQLEPQIEAAYEAATGQRRQSVIKRQVITIPGQPGRVQQVVRRLPTPTPDVIERVFIVKPQRDTVNLIIERPSTPPAQYKDKTVYGKQRRPLINPKIIQVPSRQGPIGTLSSYYPYYT